MFTFDYSEVTRGFDKFNRDLEKNVEKVEKESISRLEKTAREIHRYRPRTGKLQRATKGRVVESKKDVSGVELYIDRGVAPYGLYIHDGHRSWAPDTFVTDAMEKHEEEISKKYEKAFSDAITSSGL